MPDSFFPTKQISFLNQWFKETSGAKMQSLGVQGGFSGAVIWRLSLHGKYFCLRRWPRAHPTIDGLLAIHGLLQHVAAAGYRVAPEPMPTLTGDTFFVNEDHLWELTPWMPGVADFGGNPSPVRLTAAMQALADFHQAAGTFAFRGAAAHIGPSAGLRDRLTLLSALQQGGLPNFRKATRSAEDSDLRELAFELLENIGSSLDRVVILLKQVVDAPLALQWVLRDVRHNHLLFTGDRVTGLLDFGAVAVDSVACDVARLLGSMINDNTEIWEAGIQAYEGMHKLSLDEHRAIAAFDEGGTLCSAANWIRWLFVEGRSFPQIHALHEQLVWLRNRLQQMSGVSHASVSPPARQQDDSSHPRRLGPIGLS